MRAERPPTIFAPIAPVGCLPAKVMADALWIEQVSAEEAAEACQRSVEWVEGVLAGTLDPTLDELELAVNAIGLETRIALGGVDRPRELPVFNRQELADKIAGHRALDIEMHASSAQALAVPTGEAKRRFSPDI